MPPDKFKNPRQNFNLDMSFSNLTIPTFGSVPPQSQTTKSGQTLPSSPFSPLSAPSTPNPNSVSDAGSDSESGSDSISESEEDSPSANTMQLSRRDRSGMMKYSSVRPATQGQQISDHRLREIKAAPIFSARVQDTLESNTDIATKLIQSKQELFPQYSMLGNKVGSFRDGTLEQSADPSNPNNLLFLNTNEPFSTFICGSQGGGKSHTLSCILEGALLKESPVGQVKAPSSAIVFHYDQFSSHSTSQICEAAYLCSGNLPVRVIVSPTNYSVMNQVYSNLGGFTGGMAKPQVIPFYLKEEHLHIQNMKTLMSCAGGESTMPLYLERVFSILKDMAMEAGSTRARLNYREFKRQIDSEAFSKEQKGPLNQRLALLDDFMTRYEKTKLSKSSRMALAKAWEFEPGTLTIIDLSCPFVSAGDACSLFTVALSLFMESRGKGHPRMIALDEAHKFLNDSPEAKLFSDELTSIIAQQRHLAARVVIATQEPTLSPRLLELSNVSIVHHFKSPQWFATLKKYLAGPSNESNVDHAAMFREIVNLNTGEALVFAPSAVVDLLENEDGTEVTGVDAIKQQGTNVFKMMVRKRITVDGGRSIVAVSG